MSDQVRWFDPLGTGPYGGLLGFKEPTTSRDAALSMAADAKLLREKVYIAIKAASASGLTADEAATLIERTPFSVRPRFTELAKEDPPRIVDTGIRRTNESGRSAKVWRAK